MSGNAEDQATADKFASSWLNVYDASVYNHEQFTDWIGPWTEANDVRDREVLELGCGSGALLVHMAAAGPHRLCGVDLGRSVDRARVLLGARDSTPDRVASHMTDLLRPRRRALFRH